MDYTGLAILIFLCVIGVLYTAYISGRPSITKEEQEELIRARVAARKFF